MTQLTLQEAATQVGKSRSTIWRAVKSGKLSAHKQEDGDFLVDASELLRVYPHVARATSHDTANETERNINENRSLQVELEAAKQRIRDLEADKADLRGERDKLLAVVQEQASSMKLLTDQRASPAGDAPAKGFLARLFGR
ncbi:MAG: hypothetical protein HQK82_11180 [Desulfovibrionaceae bacterium]|nr:hypothetical protein [Desulfovibrionaceae bacterium]